MKTRRIAYAAALLVLVALAAALLVRHVALQGGGERPSAHTHPSRQDSETGLTGLSASKNPDNPVQESCQKKPPTRETRSSNTYSPPSPLAAHIERALDDENLPGLLACADAALASPDAEVREAMVEALGWFGAKALPELTPYLADPDESVRTSALNEWMAALEEIEAEEEKLAVAERALGVITDADALEEIAGVYIGVDESLAVASLLRVIEGGGPQAGVERAKESYEFVTGDVYENRAAAARWLAEQNDAADEE